MSATIEAWLRDILRCPVGRHELLDDNDAFGAPVLVCAEDCGGPGLRRSYPVSDGIPVLLAEEATTLTVGGDHDPRTA